EKGNHYTSKFPYKDIAPTHATDTLPRDKVVKGHTSGESIIGGASATSTARHLPVSGAAWTALETTCTIEMMKILFELPIYPRTTRDVNLHELFKSFGHVT
ncbi:hypothetical protein KI387_014081, partial [Taxus chinensis]